MEANEVHRCCHGQQQQHQYHHHQAAETETDPSAAVEAAETNEVGGGLQIGKRPIVFDKVPSTDWLPSFFSLTFSAQYILSVRYIQRKIFENEKQN